MAWVQKSIGIASYVEPVQDFLKRLPAVDGKLLLLDVDYGLYRFSDIGWVLSPNYFIRIWALQPELQPG